MKFRCPHRPWRNDPSKSRQERAAARRETYDVPADARVERREHEVSKGKEHRYADQKDHYFVITVTCPDCGDTIEVFTDTDPKGGE